MGALCGTYGLIGLLMLGTKPLLLDWLCAHRAAHSSERESKCQLGTRGMALPGNDSKSGLP